MHLKVDPLQVAIHTHLKVDLPRVVIHMHHQAPLQMDKPNPNHLANQLHHPTAILTLVQDVKNEEKINS